MTLDFEVECWFECWGAPICKRSMSSRRGGFVTFIWESKIVPPVASLMTWSSVLTNRYFLKKAYMCSTSYGQLLLSKPYTWRLESLWIFSTRHVPGYRHRKEDQRAIVNALQQHNPERRGIMLVILYPSLVGCSLGRTSCIAEPARLKRAFKSFLHFLSAESLEDRTSF